MNLKDLPPIILALLIIYLLLKDALIPLIKKMNGKNPINVDRLYQEFKDFKETQGKWNEKMERRWEKQDERIDQLEGRRP